MTAIGAVVRIIADQKKIPAIVNAQDSFNDVAILFDRMLGNNNVSYVDFCFSIHQNDFAIFQSGIHRFTFANIFMPRPKKNQRLLVNARMWEVFHFLWISITRVS